MEAEEGVDVEPDVEAAEVEAMAEVCAACVLLRPWAAAVLSCVPPSNSGRDLANILT